MYKTLGYWFVDMLNSDFLETSLVIDSAPYFVYDYSRQMLYPSNWPNPIVCLSLLLEIWDTDNVYYNWTDCFPGCYLINFENNHIFQIKLFSTCPKSEDKNLNTLKSIFSHFYRTLNSQKLSKFHYSQTWEYVFKPKL